MKTVAALLSPLLFAAEQEVCWTCVKLLPLPDAVPILNVRCRTNRSAAAKVFPREKQSAQNMKMCKACNYVYKICMQDMHILQVIMRNMHVFNTMQVIMRNMHVFNTKYAICN